MAVLWSPALAAAQQLTEVRWYDVRAIEAAGLIEPEGVDLRLSLESTFLDSMEPDSFDVRWESDSAVQADSVAELLVDALGPEWPEQGVFADSRGGFLRIEAEPATHVELTRLLDLMRAELLRTVHCDSSCCLPTKSPQGPPPCSARNK